MESKRRSLAKALSWRAGGTVVTALIALVVTGEVVTAVQIGALDTLVKILAYYGHERVWERIGYGREKAEDYEI
jgi:uncharacterized membrane protein